MEMIPVDSSNVAAIGYDSKTREMRVEFAGGGTYTHANVPKSLFNSFKSADSKGKYYAEHFRKKFGCSKL